jgi:hypothetical protein
VNTKRLRNLGTENAQPELENNISMKSLYTIFVYLSHPSVRDYPTVTMQAQNPK